MALQTTAKPTNTKPCYATSAKIPQLGKTVHINSTIVRIFNTHSSQKGWYKFI